MKGLWWQSTESGAQDLEEYQEQQENLDQEASPVSLLTLLRQQVLTALLIAGITLVMFVLYQWSTILLLAVIGTVTCIVAARLLLDSRQSHSATEQAASVTIVEDVEHEGASTAPAEETVAVKAEEAPSVEEPQQEPTFVFPDTPMPSSPLIRVLETIDLSTSNVEHFIKTTEHSVVSPKKNEHVHEDMPVNE